MVLYKHNPWSRNLNADDPIFAMYENGQIIYEKVENNSSKNYEIKLNKKVLKKTIASFSISDKLYKLSDNIETSRCTDEIINIILLNMKSEKSIAVNGFLDEYGSGGGCESRKKTPQEFLALYDKIKKFEHKNAVEWIPGKVEIAFWNYNDAPKTKPWLKNFPDLKSPTKVERPEGGYSIYINREDFLRFKPLFESLKKDEAVEINEEQMRVAYRFIFPNL